MKYNLKKYQKILCQILKKLEEYTKLCIYFDKDDEIASEKEIKRLSVEKNLIFTITIEGYLNAKS